MEDIAAAGRQLLDPRTPGRGHRGVGPGRVPGGRGPRRRGHVRGLARRRRSVTPVRLDAVRRRRTGPGWSGADRLTGRGRRDAAAPRRPVQPSPSTRSWPRSAAGRAGPPGHRRARLRRPRARRQPAGARRRACTDRARSGCCSRRTVAVTPVVSQGCRPIGEPLTVTRAERNVLYELAGRPALDRLQEIVGGARRPTSGRWPARGLHIGLVIDEHQARLRPRRLPRPQRARRRPERRRHRRRRRGRGRHDRAVPGPRRRRRRRGPPRSCSPAATATRRPGLHLQRPGHAPVRRARPRRRAWSRESARPGRRWRACSAPARSARSAAATSCTASPPVGRRCSAER